MILQVIQAQLDHVRAGAYGRLQVADHLLACERGEWYAESGHSLVYSVPHSMAAMRLRLRLAMPRQLGYGIKAALLLLDVGSAGWDRHLASEGRAPSAHPTRT